MRSWTRLVYLGMIGDYALFESAVLSIISSFPHVRCRRFSPYV